ncbi:NlpC/P60 family peptidoglycan-binding protein RipD [[Mycobacterium] crassicus]|uniref:NlpC/P60 family peptidoglycan-binding protein RipD n=1 Tax=[Mycobacterium] crassicus TaxID=2872309 RepID=A0ABU5XHV6_9MYCO|nr:NlpC/P60 family peptidoglycan-binding protein RipD [Mycolicibacter sp. MYC098]MEB3021875.1 NlpC/P60 family peptidoglycan-binding protein RipD [Mycolicibacter sp. MYC098]
MKRVYATAIALAAALAPLSVAAPAGADPQSQSGQSQLIDRVVQRALSQRGVPFVYGGGDVSGPTNGARAAAHTTGGVRGIAGLPGGPAAGIPGSPVAIPGSPAVIPGSPTTGIPGGPLVAGSATPGLPGATIPPTPALPDLTTVGFDASGLIQYAYAGAGIKMPRTSGEQCSVGHKVAPAQARPGDLLCYGPGGSQSVAMYLGNNQMIEGTSPVVAVSPARTSNMVPYLTRVIG